MIRPPASTIALSANDISVHLQRIDIYHGLLKQGFKKKDIRRYFREKCEAEGKDVNHTERADPLRAPTCAEYAGRSPRPKPTSKDQGLPDPDGVLFSDASLAESVVRASKKPLMVSARGVDVELSSNEQVERIPHVDLAEISHAPRKSSLLRFSSRLSSDEQEGVCIGASVPFSPRCQMRYRLRTDTYSYEQSDIGDESSDSSSLVTVFEELALDDSLVPTGTSEYTTSQGRQGPGRSKRPSSSSFATEIMIEGCVGHKNTSRHNTVTTMLPVATSRIVPALRLFNTQRQHVEMEDVSNSPPLAIRRASVHDRSVLASSPTLPFLPSTPRNQSHAHGARTEPRDSRLRYLDGPSFTPYNDSIPASMQPQTPADLSRTPIFDELNAMYTAPPGRLRNDSITPRLETGIDPEPGQESPTNRAISIRHRRNREYARSARIEGLRINRLRRRHLSGDRSWDTAEQFNMWRDDLDADRVGEENFEETEVLPNNTGVIRVVSGNRHANAF